MEIVRTGEREVKFYLDTAFISQYELDFETFEKRKPFNAKIVDDLLNLANEKYGLDFDEHDTPKAVYVAEDHVVMVFEKRDIADGQRRLSVGETANDNRSHRHNDFFAITERYPVDVLFKIKFEYVLR